MPNISKAAVEALEALGCEIEDANYRTHHLFGIKLPKNLEVTALKTALKSENIFV
ncbi:hypothetical protein N7U66_00410 [Lacinutrix neustonica]|uniref:Uncharacterized protein n=1 Tax=Lacinutrix neustonica TaxID=2980107 RepID=A0A9E8MXV7_9FLAO|nr:hypothetical protein [Lacinutrix neustonica]WAC02279.1 hypothetical protein N7U66_00410 [Lacinutrix neustonica]